jgi:hypothetical protein
VEPLIRTNFFISKAERQGLTRAAHRQGLSAAGLLRRILDAYLGIKPEPVAPVVFKNQPPMRQK